MSSTDPTGMTEGPSAADEGIESRFASVEEQLEDPLSVLHYYKHAIYLRNAHPEIARGTVTAYPELSDQNICVISKEYNGNTIYLVYNMGEEATELSIESLAEGTLTMLDYLSVDGSEVLLQENLLTLPAYSITYLQ